ncbi:phosphatidylinositol transfer protein CSR1 [Aulographum hederae CBS 113979]|uniref:Phosphatidylinositol transfer protein CSR1 n=1 Tax=Aulographum hederae CBS 113979 TaxID=1176131 RepID=A0A6G1GTG3_9PEZI|nr:phosphatidylinositol transfer protein CSR1 [Aulographum hederae CBS 113979]
MPSEILPGRPGNLTPEQEQKLRELWALTLRIIGVIEAPVPTPSTEANGGATPETASGSPETKKKKGRLSFFSKKSKDSHDDSDSPAPSGTSTPSADLSDIIDDSEDKHGTHAAFRAALAAHTPEEMRTAFWSFVKHDHPDGLLLRFLRARKWDVNAALVMLVATMQWRMTDSHVDDDIMLRGEEYALKEAKSSEAARKKEGDDFLAQLRMGKSFLHNFDKEGRPLCFVRVRLHKQGEQSEASLERYTVYTIETARMFLAPPVDTATIVFDMTSFSLANMDYTPVKFMIKCFEANYPESLGAVLVHKAPWVFSSIWSIIRGWLDPVVAGKVHFTKTVEDLEQYIAKDQIPKELGGTEEWEYSYPEPVEGENKTMEDTATKSQLQQDRKSLTEKYEHLLKAWVKEETSMDDARKERDAAALQLKDNYWKLDPYVRARSVYDRIGALTKFTSAGKIPTAEKTADVPAQETSQDDLD